MKYRSPYEAYPFLSDDSADLRCDFELLTDEIASRIGKLIALIRNEVNVLAERPVITEELLWVCGIVYHMNPSLRTSFRVTEEETERLKETVQRSADEADERKQPPFVLPVGTEAACEAHLLRVQCKQLVRLLYRHLESGGEVPDRLFDTANLLSGYFFFLALDLNNAAGMKEIPFESRNYSPHGGNI